MYLQIEYLDSSNFPKHKIYILQDVTCSLQQKFGRIIVYVIKTNIVFKHKMIITTFKNYI